MKNFFRTIPGKTLLFITCILSALSIAVCAVSAGLMYEFEIYTKSEDQMLSESIRELFVGRGGDLLCDHMMNQDHSQFPDDGNMRYRIIRQTTYGERMEMWSEGAVGLNAENWVYEPLYFAVKYDYDRGEYVYHWYAATTDLQNYQWNLWADAVYRMDYSLDTRFPHDDIYSLMVMGIEFLYFMKRFVWIIAVASLLVGIVSFVTLMSVAGRKPKSDEIEVGVLYRVPFDVLVAACLFLGLILVYTAWEIFRFESSIMFDVVFGFICLIGLNIGLGLCMSIAVRCKKKTLLTNTLIYKCIALGFRLLKGLFKGILAIFKLCVILLLGLPSVWLVALVVCGICFVDFVWLLICWSGSEFDMYSIFWVLLRIVMVPAILYIALLLRKLEKGGEALAEGDLTYHTDLKGLFGPLKRHGENLNSLGDGMTLAVEERMKSERMKTELITNVSHDIKTPLTSIINYANLIGEEPCENEKIMEYSEVLVRQSERLKRLIEDLVEASKASTGNLEVNPEPCDASVFLTQAAGEFEDKLEKAGLTLMTRQPDNEVMIMADSRRMWRIFDNLMNNICKYAQEGTRVYLSLEQVNGQAVITFKNTSRDSLDVSEEELMERFVRGDASRNTEGNGLGLSIAKSMAELQKGSLKVVIDGDLFKAILSFPLLESAE